ncbi:MAG TPA: class I SAM-dependent methyltransferase [Polyangiaceae bacterium]
MTTTKQHYDELLGRVYAWSVASAGDPMRWLEARALLDAQRYLDLGAGFGAHALPLLAAGKQVTAVDFNAELLGQLRDAAGTEPGLTLQQADLINYLEACGDAEWDVILCLGDTLTHLESAAAVQQLFAGVARHLRSGGRFALGYRDSSAFAAEGLARFVPVASDRTRVMYCLLEAIDATYLRVTDIVTELTAEGPRTRLGEYQKLRLAREVVTDWAGRVGLVLLSEGVERGMTSLVFQRP